MINRRNFMVGAAGVALATQVSASEVKPTQGKQRSLILLWQDGGPSHFETFDPKPEATADFRGEFDAIQTTLPGYKFCEVLPKLSKIAHKFCVIRSLHQPSSGHVDGSHNVLTGYDNATLQGKSQYPDLATIINHIRTITNKDSQLPHYISLGNGIHRGGPAYLGSSYGPFKVSGDPSKPFFQMKDLQPSIDKRRFMDRWNILNDLQVVSGDGFKQQAFDLLSGSGKAAQTFDLTREPQSIREAYGHHTSGQQLLMARRLVEAGVSVVAVRFCPDGRGDYEKTGIGWDDHAVHGNIFEIMRKRGPKFDNSIYTLITDLEQRGLQDEVMVVVMGEFGRTPKIYNHKGCPGREHWGRAGCAMIYGGGTTPGQVIGATNDRGQHPIKRALKSQEVLATIYNQLGINLKYTLNDNGRPIHIVQDHARPIKELCS